MWIRLGCAWVVLVVSGVAYAQIDPAPEPGFATSTDLDSNLLWRPAGPSDFATLRSTRIAPHLFAFVGAAVGYQHKPVVVRQEDGPSYAAVRTQVNADLSLALGLADQFQVGFLVPTTLMQSGVGTAPIQGDLDPARRSDLLVLRDIRFGVDWRLPWATRAQGEDGFGLLLSAGLSAPTADKRVFGGSDQWTFVPGVVADYRVGRVLVALDVSARVRGSSRALGAARFGSNVVTRLGAGYAVGPPGMELSLEGGAVFELADQPAIATEAQHAYEGGVGFHYAPKKPGDYAVHAALTGGTGGFGAPLFRILLVLEYRTDTGIAELGKAL